MKNFHLIGQSIQTSLSPLIHNYLFKLKGLSQYKYSIYYQQNHLLTLKDLQKQNISGLSITIPFKQSYKQEMQNSTLKTASQLSIIKTQQKQQNSLYRKTAEDILQRRFIINTIRKNHKHFNQPEQKSFSCFNTDIFGIKQCLKKNQVFSSFQKNNNAKSNHVQSLATRAIIIGGGATAQTFMSYFEQNSIKITVINRSVEKIIKLEKDGYYSHIQKVLSFDDKNSILQIRQNQQQNYHNLIVINTLPTSILRENIGDKLDNSLKELLKISNKLNNIFYMDVNYRDSQETLFKVIQSYTNKKVKLHKLSTGLDMLVWQAILQNYLFCQQDKLNKKVQQEQFDEQFVKIMSKLKQQGKA